MAASDFNVMDRILSQLATCLTPDSAQRLLDFQLDSETRARIDDLADRASEGQLSFEERSEYEEFIELIDIIGILQSNARRPQQVPSAKADPTC